MRRTLQLTLFGIFVASALAGLVISYFFTDWITRDLIERELDKIYGELGVPEQWKLLRYDVAHQETAEGRAEILRFLKRYL